MWRAVLCAVLVLCAAVSARAQPTAEDSAAARTLFEEGRVLAQQGAWAEAADRFARALALRPSVQIRYNLAVALDRTGRLAQASEQLRTMLSDLPAGDAARARAEQLLSRIEPRVGRVTIVLGADTAEVEVLLDDHPVPAARLGVATPIDPGPHRAIARRAGAEVARDFAVAEGQSVDVALEAPPRPSPPPAPAELDAPNVSRPQVPAPRVARVAPPEARARPKGRARWPWFVAAAAALAAGLALDFAPESARNHELDVLDGVPVALYGGAAGALLVGVF